MTFVVVCKTTFAAKASACKAFAYVLTAILWVGGGLLVHPAAPPFRIRLSSQGPYLKQSALSTGRHLRWSRRANNLVSVVWRVACGGFSPSFAAAFYSSPGPQSTKYFTYCSFAVIVDILDTTVAAPRVRGIYAKLNQISVDIG